MICSNCGYLNSDDQIRCVQCSTSLNRFESPTLDYRLSTDRVTVGEIFAGRYRILRMLKSGGMSFVYEAFDEKVQQKVALKILKPGLTEDATTIRRFQGEVRLARRIGHQNVCRIYDLEESNGILFISMELIEGLNLKERIQKMGPMTEKEGIPFCIQILDGLQSAHSSGIIHRDLKPQNIMIDPNGNPRILDFGLSRALDAEGVTLFGAVMGTPGYMAPEQGLGETAEERSDIYSMGAIMYELFTGTLPFQAETPAKLIYKHVYTAPTDPKKRNPDISSALSKVILRCLEKKKEKRYRNVGELIQALKLLDEGKPLPANLTTPSRFHPALLVLAVVLLAVIGTAGYLTYSYFKKPEKRVAITILPFRSPDEKSELSPSMLSLTQNVILNLITSPRVKVYPYDRLFEAQNILQRQGLPGTELTAINLLGELNGSSYVIVPSVFQFGNKMRVTLEMKNPKNGETVKVKTLEYSFKQSPEERMLDVIHDASAEIEKEVGGKGGEYTPLSTNAEVLLGYTRGKNAFLQGKYPEAIQFFQTCLNQDAGFPDALASIADSYHHMGYDGQAAKFAKDAALACAQRNLPAARTLHIQAKQAEIDYDFSRAEKLYRQLTDLTPDDATLFVSLGKALQSLTKNREAHAAFQQAVRLSTFYPEAYLAEADLMAQEAKSKEALENMDRALFEYAKLKNADQQARVLFAKAVVYRDNSQFEKMETTLQEADSLTIHTQVPLLRARLLKLQADLNLIRGNNDEAMTQYREAIERFQEAGDQKTVGSIYINIASLYSLERNWSETEKNLLKGKEIAENIQNFELKRDAYFNLASAYFRQNRLEDALAYLDQAIVVDRKTGDQASLILEFNLKADIYLKQGNYDLALKAYQDQLAAAQRLGDQLNQAYAYSGLGDYFYEIENYEEAVKNYQKAVELNQKIDRPPGIAYSSLFIGKCLSLQGRFAESEPYFKTVEQVIANGQYSRVAELKNTIAFNELQKGNWKAAAQSFNEAAGLAKKEQRVEEVERAEFYHQVVLMLESNKGDVAAMQKIFASSPKNLQLEFAPLIALAYERNGQERRALDLLLTQLNSTSRKPMTRLILCTQIARLEKKLGNETEASRYSQQAQELSNQIHYQPRGKVAEALLKT